MSNFSEKLSRLLGFEKGFYLTRDQYGLGELGEYDGETILLVLPQHEGNLRGITRSITVLRDGTVIIEDVPGTRGFVHGGGVAIMPPKFDGVREFLPGEVIREEE